MKTSLAVVARPGRKAPKKPLDSYQVRGLKPDRRQVVIEVKERAFALYDEYARRLAAEDRAEDPIARLWLRSPRRSVRIGPLTLDAYLREEAKRLGLQRHDWDWFVWMTRVLAEWALQETVEHNQRIAARFAADWIFDRCVRIDARSAMAMPRPRRWYWRWDRDDRGRQRLLQTWWEWATSPAEREARDAHDPDYDDGDGAPVGYVPPFLGAEIDRLRDAPLPLRQILDGNRLVESRFEVGRKHGEGTDCDRLVEYEPNRYARIMDVLRPPLMTIRLAARIINERVSRDARLRVLALELGNWVGPQALSVWLDRRAQIQHEAVRQPGPLPEPVSNLPGVHTYSAVYDPHVPPMLDEGVSDAVVVGIPALHRIIFAKMMVDPDLDIDRRDIDPYWEPQRRLKIDDLLVHVESYVQAAIPFVRPGGLLVVIGATDDGVHHHANRFVRDSDQFVPVSIENEDGERKLCTVEWPVEVAYSKPPWAPFGVIPPGDRLVSAWRRRP